MDTLVSVIVPVYKVEKYINEAVDSIVNQTYRNLEIILVDDGSPDNCGKICEGYASYDTRIKVIHKSNGGVSSARNTGVEAASGGWIYFMDSDDWIEPDTIETVLSYALKNNCDMCMFDYDQVFENKRVYHNALKYGRDVFTELNRNDVFLAYACGMGSIWNIITKTTIIKQLKFDEHVSVREDELFKWQLYGKIKSFCYVREGFYHYRYRRGSAVTSSDLGTRIANRTTIYKNEIAIISNANYPENAIEAVHSKYLEGFWSTCCAICKMKIPAKEKRVFYNKYINNKEFKESLRDFNDLYFARINAICLKKRKAPHWLLVRMMIIIRDIRNLCEK